MQTRLLILYCTDNAARLFSRSFVYDFSELQMELLKYAPWADAPLFFLFGTGFSELQMKLLIYVPYVTGFSVLQMKLLVYVPYVTGFSVLQMKLLIYMPWADAPLFLKRTG